MNLLEIDPSEQFEYNPNRLLNELRAHLGLASDAKLCELLDIAPPVISKIRHKKLAIGATLLIRIHEETNWSLKEIRARMGDNRPKFTEF